MQCRNCGTEIADRALICYRCGTATTEAKYKAPSAHGGGRGARGSRTRALVAVLIAVLLALLGLFLAFGEYPGAYAG